MISKSKRARNIILSIGLTIIVIATLGVLIVFRRGTLGLTSAITNQIYFSPSPAYLPPDRVFDLLIDSPSSQVGFINISVLFDKSKMNLTDEVIVSDIFDTVIQKSTMSEANSTGRIDIVAAVSPTNISIAPSGVINFAQLPFTAVTQEENATTTLTIDDQTIQLVDLTAAVLTNAWEPGTVYLNQRTPVPTSTTAPTPTPKGKGKPGGSDPGGVKKTPQGKPGNR